MVERLVALWVAARVAAATRVGSVVNPGGGVVVDPTGAIVVGPVNREQRIVYADCDPARAAVARRSLDVTGHYNRPDIFRLEINRSARPPVTFAGR